jgi:hypothetical protein
VVVVEPVHGVVVAVLAVIAGRGDNNANDSIHDNCTIVAVTASINGPPDLIIVVSFFS